MDTSGIVDRLQAHGTLHGAPREELEWIAAHGTMQHFVLGDLLDQMAQGREGLIVVLSGHFSIYVDHGAGPHKVMEWGTGDVSGLLPYSRMSKPIGAMSIEEPGDVLLVPKECFPEMIRECPVITATLVHVMVDRARQFRSSELQDEKMLSLGKLAAGLAHELNNPASAAARSSRLLSEGLDEAEAAAHALGAARLTDTQLEAVDRARRVCATSAPSALAPLERSDREEAIADWLAAHGANASSAASLAETAVTIEGLDTLASMLDVDTLNIALRWVAAGCTTRALASEVERAATRIHTLVGAIKRFAYMDRAQVAEPIDLVGSLNDSLALLLHKARKKSVGVVIQAEPNLPAVCAIGGDLNQVWTNLIDNAIDAVPESGHVTVSAERHRERVVVHVVDDGSGIAPEIRDRIFDPFITSKPVGQGTGLGLDIARQLVRRNNGDIEVDSRPGRTEFRVSFPIASNVVAGGSA